MLNKLLRFVREQHMVSAGDEVVCAVSGGADSVALLFAMYLLAPKLQITVKAAHFNHGLRGAESDRDEEFVKVFCSQYDIPVVVGRGEIKAGKKGLEASAREARYAFFATLSGKIATAHTADDNAETVLMHMIRGSGLKGLGGITPVRGNVIRPMLCITRREVLEFLEEYHLSYVQDSSNDTDAFLRNRLRHHVMPQLIAENPQLALHLSATAMRLREDELYLSSQASANDTDEVDVLSRMPQPIRRRVIAGFLSNNGVKEPSAEQIESAENLLFVSRSTAVVQYARGVRIGCRDGRLVRVFDECVFEQINISCPGEVELPQLGIRITCVPDHTPELKTDSFTVQPAGQLTVRPRCSGDSMRLSGGTKTLKKLFIDKKIPSYKRSCIPVIADESGVLGVWGIGANLDRHDPDKPGILICFERL